MTGANVVQLQRELTVLRLTIPEKVAVPMTGLCKQRGERQAQIGQQWCGEHVLRFQGQDGGLPIAAVDEAVDFDLREFRVEDPIFWDAVMLIALALDHFVQPAISFGQYLDHQGRDTADVRLRHDRRLGGGDEHQVGLHHIEVGEDDVVRRDEDLAEGMIVKKVLQCSEECSGCALMFRVGRRRHNMLSIDHFVALPVVGDQAVVFVGDFQMAGVGRHTHLTRCFPDVLQDYQGYRDIARTMKDSGLLSEPDQADEPSRLGWGGGEKGGQASCREAQRPRLHSSATLAGKQGKR